MRIAEKSQLAEGVGKGGIRQEGLLASICGGRRALPGTNPITRALAKDNIADRHTIAVREPRLRDFGARLHYLDLADFLVANEKNLVALRANHIGLPRHRDRLPMGKIGGENLGDYCQMCLTLVKARAYNPRRGQ